MQHSVDVTILQHVGGNDDECGLLPLDPWRCLSRQPVYGTVCSGARVRIALIDGRGPYLAYKEGSEGLRHAGMEVACVKLAAEFLQAEARGIY